MKRVPILTSGVLRLGQRFISLWNKEVLSSANILEELYIQTAHNELFVNIFIRSVSMFRQTKCGADMTEALLPLADLC
jgi:hypothetical protein